MTATQRTTREVYSTSIHPITGQEISHGNIPAGTDVLRLVKRVPTLLGSDDIQFVIRDEKGEWLEQTEEAELEKAGISINI